MDHDARKTVGNGKRHDTQVVPYGAIPEICITKRERHTGRSLHLCLVGNGLCAIPILRCRVEHVFDEDAVSRCGVVHENMGHRAHQFAVLYNRRAGHADVK